MWEGGKGAGMSQSMGGSPEGSKRPLILRQDLPICWPLVIRLRSEPWRVGTSLGLLRLLGSGSIGTDLRV